ncbi:MAG: flavodoxin family protein [Candidatus Spyradocola sp.]|nr:flavodoxin family protein [Candidatus Spyradocola sp.]
MKVLLLNGSPNARGCTWTALNEVKKGLEAQGVEGEIVHVCAEDVPGCTGCFACGETRECVRGDVVNEIGARLRWADGMVIGSPVYFASPNGSLLAFLDRLYASHGEQLRFKPCGCIVSARRAGTTAALDALNKYPLVCDQPLVSGGYWCMVHGQTPEEVMRDEEGLRIARTLGSSLGWLVKALALSREAGLEAPDGKE